MLNTGNRSVRFGLNYTPGHIWYYIWNDWDLGSIIADFDAMATTGIDHVRIQLIWPYFQPNPTYVSPAHLERLGELMKVAEDRGIDVLVTLLTGYLSGYTFLPSRVTRMGVFTDRKTIEMEKVFARAVVEHVRDRPNFMGVDLGNEINCLTRHELATDVGDAWARELLETINPLLGEAAMCVNGIDHTPVFDETTFSMEHLADDYPTITIHTWPMFTGCLEKGDLPDAPATELAGFCAQLCRLYAKNRDKPVWVQELGACDLWGSDAQQIDYLKGVVPAGIDGGVRLFTWWCSHDKRDLLEFKDWEYRFGLFTPDNKPKHLVQPFREMVDNYANRQDEPEFDVAIVVPDEFRPARTKEIDTSQWILQALASTTWNLYDLFLRQTAAGRKPKLIREEDADRFDHVLRPGMDELTRYKEVQARVITDETR